MRLLETIAEEGGRLHSPAFEDLRKLLEALPCLEEELPRYASVPGAFPYGRNVLFAGDGLEVIAITLPPWRRTAIHDHGASYGCAVVAEGVLTNTVYEPVSLAEAEALGEERIEAGGFLFSPPGLIHRMSNRTSRRVLSLHAYAPPLAGMKTYRAAERQLASNYSI